MASPGYFVHEVGFQSEANERVNSEHSRGVRKRDRPGAMMARSRAREKQVSEQQTAGIRTRTGECDARVAAGSAVPVRRGYNGADASKQSRVSSRAGARGVLGSAGRRTLVRKSWMGRSHRLMRVPTTSLVRYWASGVRSCQALVWPGVGM